MSKTREPLSMEMFLWSRSMTQLPVSLRIVMERAFEGSVESLFRSLEISVSRGS